MFGKYNIIFEEKKLGSYGFFLQSEPDFDKETRRIQVRNMYTMTTLKYVLQWCEYSKQREQNIYQSGIYQKKV